MLKKQFLVITLFLINTTMFAMNDNPPAAAHSERTTIGEQTLYSERTTINTPNITSNQNTYNINNGPNLTGKKFSENLVFNAAAVIANAGAEGIVKGAYDAAVNVAVILTVDMLKKNVLPESADERNIREFVMKNTKIENLSKLGERINKYSRRAEDKEELRPQAEQL